MQFQRSLKKNHGINSFLQILNLILFPLLDQRFGIYLENNFLLLKDFYFFIIILLYFIFQVAMFPIQYIACSAKSFVLSREKKITRYYNKNR